VQAKVAAAREELTRVGQTRNDVQAELQTAQRTLASTRRDLSEADRNLQNSTQKVSDAQASTEESTETAEAATPRRSTRGRHSGRRRTSRSFRIRSR
jgi:chromosome segregation ATPase